MKVAAIDILIPTYRRPAALAVTLTSLIGQTFRDFRVVISDQTEESDPTSSGEVLTAMRVLHTHGHAVEVYKHLPRRGLAEQRQFLLDQATAPAVLFIDNDLILETYVIERMWAALQEGKCGFVGSAVHGLSYINDVRPHQQAIEFWDGPVQPEIVRPELPTWERHKLHSAANLYHVQNALGLTPQKQRKYKVAWVGACVMYDTDKLRTAGGFNFWRELPTAHAGEDVLAQQRVMARFGGCAIIPSGVYHQELPTTIPEREVDAPKYLGLELEENVSAI